SEPTGALPPLPVEATLRAAMDDIGRGFWPLLIVGAVAFVPIWAVVAVLGGNGLGSIVQFLTIVPSAALLAAAGAIRADRPATLGGSYRHAVARLLDYFLANLVVGAIIVVILVVPAIVIAVAIALVFVSGSQETSALIGVVVLMALVGLIPVTYVAGRLALVGPLVVVEGLGVGEAVGVGWRRTRHQVFRLLVVFFIGCIPGWLIALGLAMLGFGVFGIDAVAGAILGLGYAVAIVVLSCVTVAAWQQLGGIAPADLAPAGSSAATTIDSTSSDAASPAAPTRRSDRGPLTAIVLIVAGLVLVIAGSVAAAGKVGGWIGALGGRHEGTISYGVNGLGCFQLDPRSDFEAGQIIHMVAPLPYSLPVGERVQFEVYADGDLIDRGFEAPFAEQTDCLFFDLDTTAIKPAAYTFRYLWGAELLAEGTFTIRP
ncbi:MAG TPA: hypothetical protein VMT36_01115, partial [Candidatus Saccharimonadia bacterium]|nr:hypothetical protein [Candidatus Saccharimonadia bacterium]